MPDGDKRKVRNDSVKGINRGQQLSDRRAALVAKRKMSYTEAMKADKKDDAKKYKAKTISKQGRGGTIKMKSIKGRKLNVKGETENY